MNPEGPLKPRPKPASGTVTLPLAVLPAFLGRFLKRYPSLVRHPHPFAVHFPIVFLYAAAFFDLLYLGTGSTSLETSGFHFLGAGVLSLPLAMLTGEIIRRVAYSQEPVQNFHIEIYLSGVLLALAAAAFVWRWLDPLILRDFGWTGLLYLLIILALPAIATYISYFGGLLTFPLNEDR